MQDPEQEQDPEQARTVSVSGIIPALLVIVLALFGCTSPEEAAPVCETEHNACYDQEGGGCAWLVECMADPELLGGSDGPLWCLDKAEEPEEAARLFIELTNCEKLNGESQ